MTYEPFPVLLLDVPDGSYCFSSAPTLNIGVSKIHFCPIQEITCPYYLHTTNYTYWLALHKVAYAQSVHACIKPNGRESLVLKDHQAYFDCGHNHICQSASPWPVHCWIRSRPPCSLGQPSFFITIIYFALLASSSARILCFSSDLFRLLFCICQMPIVCTKGMTNWFPFSLSLLQRVYCLPYYPHQGFRSKSYLHSANLNYFHPLSTRTQPSHQVLVLFTIFYNQPSSAPLFSFGCAQRCLLTRKQLFVLLLVFWIHLSWSPSSLKIIIYLTFILRLVMSTWHQSEQVLPKSPISLLEKLLQFYKNGSLRYKMFPAEQKHEI